jgi:hypothetical protein
MPTKLVVVVALEPSQFVHLYVHIFNRLTPALVSDAEMYSLKASMKQLRNGSQTKGPTLEPC